MRVGRRNLPSPAVVAVVPTRLQPFSVPLAHGAGRVREQVMSPIAGVTDAFAPVAYV